MVISEVDSYAAIMPGATDRDLPGGACDTHNHVFGPFDRYPLEYPPDHGMPLAPIDTYLQMLDNVGLERGVLVQPTQQDCQMDVMLDALGKSAGRLRGVGAARSDTDDDEFARMATAGVVGLRFVEAPLPSGAPRPGAVGFDEIADLASRLRDLDWSINVWGRIPTLMDNIDKLMSPGVPVVFEHMGMLDPQAGIQHEHFQTLLSLVREGQAWVKLSFCRCSAEAPLYEDLRPFVNALTEANPDRLLWGSDWPFIRMQGTEPDANSLVRLMLDWIDDADIHQKILVANPERLYKFRSAAGRN